MGVSASKKQLQILSKFPGVPDDVKDLEATPNYFS